jgi:TolB-like protein/Flp pilus assembly protein TadD
MTPKMWIAPAVSVALAAILFLNIGGLRRRLFPGGNPASVRSLAVLPLENLSRDPDQEYFSDGMTDELITTLGKIGALRVISRSSAMVFKGVKKPLAEIAKALEVDALIEGSVFRSGDRVRINAELVTPQPERHLWADSYERETSDVLAIQADVAQAIAHQIRVRLTPDEASRIASSRPVNPAAYEAYLRGRSLLLDQANKDGYAAAAHQFESAIELDSTYSPPWAGLADMYYLISSVYLPAREAMPKAEAMATRALYLDSTSAAAHATLGFVRSQYYRDWEGADRELLRSIRLNPNDAIARMYHAYLLLETGHLSEARSEIHRAHELDPQSNYIAVAEGNMYLFAGMCDSATIRYRFVIARDPGNYAAHARLALCDVLSHNYQPAIKEIRVALSMPGDPAIPALAAYIFASAGSIREAEAALDSLVNLNKREHVPAYSLATAYAALGKTDQAFYWLNAADRNREEDLYLLNVDFPMQSLRSDPRFGKLLRRLRLAA